MTEWTNRCICCGGPMGRCTCWIPVPDCPRCGGELTLGEYMLTKCAAECGLELTERQYNDLARCRLAAR